MRVFTESGSLSSSSAFFLEACSPVVTAVVFLTGLAGRFCAITETLSANPELSNARAQARKGAKILSLRLCVLAALR
jgi:hypothetical protein